MVSGLDGLMKVVKEKRWISLTSQAILRLPIPSIDHKIIINLLSKNVIEEVCLLVRF